MAPGGAEGTSNDALGDPPKESSSAREACHTIKRGRGGEERSAINEGVRVQSSDYYEKSC